MAGRPRDAIDDGAQPRGSYRGLEQVNVSPTTFSPIPAAISIPRSLPPPASTAVPPTTKPRSKHVPDRIGQVGATASGAAASRMQDALECERRAQRRRAQAGNGAVHQLEVVSRRESPRMNSPTATYVSG